MVFLDWVKRLVPNGDATSYKIKMPSCCVPTCKNSSSKGYLLKCFPKNDKRRTQWIKNINRSDWLPNHSHRVCEAHFAPSMWEKTRVDGSRKLKYNAVPTIFGDRIMEDSVMVQTVISSVKNFNEDEETKPLENNSLKNIVFSNNKTLIKIIPPANSSNSQSTPILFPASTIFGAQSINPTSAIIVNSQGKIFNTHSSIISGATSILKSQIKTMNMQSSPMIISTNASILKNQIKAANSKTPIIIPATTSILKSQNPITSSQLTSINLTNTIQVKAANTQPILIPMTTSVLKAEVQTTNSEVTSKIVTNNIVPRNEADAINSESPLTKNLINFNMGESKSKSISHQPNSIVKSSGIILNKAQAKKIEDERFEKMDKLLLKQLRLNNALRKKLNLMNNKMQQLMKEQNSDYKAFLMDVFTEDQIRALELRHTNPKSITAWSHKTMIKAIKLKEECGTRGYEELLNQNMPLPSVRTISRWCTARNLPIP